MFCPGPKRSDMFARCIFILLKHAETRQTNVHTADPHYWNAPPLWYLQEPCLYLGSQHGKLRPACCGNTLDVTFSGWWFQTFFIFHHTWDNPSHWLIFFKMVKTTNQYSIAEAKKRMREKMFLIAGKLVHFGTCGNRVFLARPFSCL